MLPAALLVEQDVRGLHIPVDSPLCMRGVEHVGDLRGDRDGPRVSAVVSRGAP